MKDTTEMQGYVDMMDRSQEHQRDELASLVPRRTIDTTNPRNIAEALIGDASLLDDVVNRALVQFPLELCTGSEVAALSEVEVGKCNGATFQVTLTYELFPATEEALNREVPDV